MQTQPLSTQIQLTPVMRINNVISTIAIIEPTPLIRLKKINVKPDVREIRSKPFPVKEIAGKVAIAPIKNSSITKRKQRIRRKKKEIEAARLIENENISKSKAINKDTNVQKANNLSKQNEIITSVASCDIDQVEKNNENDNKQKSNKSNEENKNSSNNLLLSVQIDDVKNQLKEGKPALTPNELSNNLLEDFNINQTETNHASLSPTAAFLLSFPVVSSTSSKPIETETAYSTGLNMLDKSSNQQNDHILFENISTFFGIDSTASPSVNKNESTTCGITVDPQKHSKEKRKHKASNFSGCSGQQHNNILDKQIENIGSDLSGANSVAFSNSTVASLSANQQNTIKHIDKHQSKYNVQERNTVKNEGTPLNTQKLLFGLPSSNTPASTSATECSNPSDFYESLSSIGMPNIQNLTTTSYATNVSGSNTNYTISSLSQPRKPIESTTFIAQPPFTFSLTRPATSDPIYSDNMTRTASHKSVVQKLDTNGSQYNVKSTANKTMPTKHSITDRFITPTPSFDTNHSNTFNPFSFDNSTTVSAAASLPINTSQTYPLSSVGSLPSFPYHSGAHLLGSTAATTIASNNQFTFTLTPTTAANPINVLAANHEPTTTNTFSSLPFDGSSHFDFQQDKRNEIMAEKLRQSPIPSKRSHSHSHSQSQSQYETLKPRSNQTVEEKKITSTSKLSQDKKHLSPTKVSRLGKQHVNWMTSASSSNKTSNSTVFDFPSTTSHYPYHQHQHQHHTQSQDENLQWSPNRILDTPNFIPTPVLPTLHGDLALNTISNSITCVGSKHDSDVVKNNTIKRQSIDRKTYSSDKKMPNMQQFGQFPTSGSVSSNENPAPNILSVSQLVEQSPQTYKYDYTHDYDAKVHSNKHKIKETNNQREKYYTKSNGIVPNSFNSGHSDLNSFLPMPEHHNNKHTNNSNNYSAEALISTTSTHSNAQSNHAKRHKTMNSSCTLPAPTDYYQNTQNCNNMDYSGGGNDIYNPYYAQNCENDYYSAPNFNSGSFGLSNQQHSMHYQQFHHSHQQNQNNYSPFNETHPFASSLAHRSYHLDSYHSQDTSNGDNMKNLHIEQKLTQLNFPSHDSQVPLSSHKSDYNSSNNKFISLLPPPLPSSTRFTYPPPPLPSATTTSQQNYNSKTNNFNKDYIGGPSIQNNVSNQFTNGINQAGMQPLIGNSGLNNNNQQNNAITNFNLSTICPEINQEKQSTSW